MLIPVKKVDATLADQALKIIKQAKHEIDGEEAFALTQSMMWLADLSKRIKDAAAAAELAPPAAPPIPPETAAAAAPPASLARAPRAVSDTKRKRSS